MLALVDGQGELAFLHVLHDRGCAVRHGEVGRALDRNRVALLVAVDAVLEFFFVAAIDEAAHHAGIFEDRHRFLGDNVRGQCPIGHCWFPSGRRITAAARLRASRRASRFVY
jgi:hypothetical protein